MQLPPPRPPARMGPHWFSCFFSVFLYVDTTKHRYILFPHFVFFLFLLKGQPRIQCSPLCFFTSCIFEIFPLLYRESFLILSPLYSVLWMGHSLFNQSPEHWGCFQAFALASNLPRTAWSRSCFALCKGVR